MHGLWHVARGSLAPHLFLDAALPLVLGAARKCEVLAPCTVCACMWLRFHGCVRVLWLQNIPRTAAEVAFMDPEFFLQSDLYQCVVSELAQADQTQLKGGDAFLASIDVKDRQWVQLLEAGAPSTKPFTKPGCVSATVVGVWCVSRCACLVVCMCWLDVCACGGVCTCAAGWVRVVGVRGRAG